MGKRTYLLLLILLALGLQSLIPAGFMPQAGKTFSVTLCTSTGYTHIQVDDTGAPVPADDKPHQSCPYAPLLTYNVTPHAPVILAAWTEAAEHPASPNHFHLKTLPSNTSPRGPPSSFSLV